MHPTTIEHTFSDHTLATNKIEGNRHIMICAAGNGVDNPDTSSPTNQHNQSSAWCIHSQQADMSCLCCD
eukprot:11647726-Ditylum_brightwellii.AAC.1